jgi:hypothetical protein
MPCYKLTRRAEQDYREILAFTLNTWGIDQFDKTHKFRSRLPTEPAISESAQLGVIGSDSAASPTKSPIVLRPSTLKK